MFKRGVSPVVATMLLLVITVLLAALIMTFVVPFVQDSLGNSKECLDVLDGIEFAESQFNCFDVDTGETGFSVKIKKEKVSGFKISLIDYQDNSDPYEVKDGGSSNNIRMIDSTYDAVLYVASSGGQRTYAGRAIYSKAEIAPISESGKVCEVSDTIEFTECLS